MNTDLHFAPAPWPRYLKLSSSLGTALLIGVGIASYRAIPVPSGFTDYFGLGITLLLLAILAFSVLSTITGYTVSSSDLTIQHLLWATHVPLAGLSRTYFEPSVCKGSIRIFGNAGLFGFSGIYRNSGLGRFRLFATNLTHSVVLVLPGRTVVITPAAPHAFVEHIYRTHPATRENAEHVPPAT